MLKHVSPEDFWRVHITHVENMLWTAQSAAFSMSDMYSSIGEIDHVHFVPWNQSTFECGRQQLELLHKENENMLVTVTVPAVQLERDALSDTTVKCKNMVVYPRSLLST